MIFGLAGIAAILYVAVRILREKTTPSAPRDTRFDWDAYWEDIENGISVVEQIRKRERGGYQTTKPKPKEWYELPIDTVVDVERYEHDKRMYGESIAELNRKNGLYRQKRKYR